MADVWFPNWKEDITLRYDFKLHRVGRRNNEIQLTQNEELILEVLCFRLATETTPMTEAWVCQLCVKLCRMLDIYVPENCSVQNFCILIVVLQFFNKNNIEGLIIDTYWCGSGNVSRGPNELGPNFEVDSCCFDHDHCAIHIEAGETKYGKINLGQYA